MIAGSAAAADLRARATPYGLQRMRRRQPRAAGCEHGRKRSVCNVQMLLGEFTGKLTRYMTVTRTP